MQITEKRNENGRGKKMAGNTAKWYSDLSVLVKRNQKKDPQKPAKLHGLTVVMRLSKASSVPALPFPLLPSTKKHKGKKEKGHLFNNCLTKKNRLTEEPKEDDHCSHDQDGKGKLSTETLNRNLKEVDAERRNGAEFLKVDSGT